MSGENEGCIKELLSIKETRTPIELFERLARKNHITVVARKLFFINPHYEIKFGLKPRKLTPLLANIPVLRNFFTTCGYYVIAAK